MLKKLATVKHKDILRETLLELLRKGSYVCIYPARGSETYDQYFQQVRPLNRFLNKVLFQNETLEGLKVPASRAADETPEPKGKMDNFRANSSSKGQRSSDGVDFKGIKNQLDEIQNVAREGRKGY